MFAAEMCHRAAIHGRFKMLKFMHTHGWSWDERTTYTAAVKGHLDCLKYAVEHGCPVHENILEVATGECLEFLRSS